MNTEKFGELPQDVQDLMADYSALPEHDRERIRMLVKLTNRHDERLRPLMHAFMEANSKKSFRRVCNYLDAAIAEVAQP